MERKKYVFTLYTLKHVLLVIRGIVTMHSPSLCSPVNYFARCFGIVFERGKFK